jgi:universal stress protein E
MQIMKILLELDPERENRPAIDRARMIASALGAAVDVVVCEHQYLFPATKIVDPGVIQTMRKDYLDAIKDWAHSQAQPLVAAGIDVKVEPIRSQPRYAAVLEYADKSGAGLIIRMAGERGRLKKFFFGTNDRELIRHAAKPLWLVQAANPGADKFNFLAAVDPTHPQDEHMELDKQILDFAAGVSAAMSGELHVYHALSTMMMVPMAPDVPTMAPPMPRFDPAVLEEIKGSHRSMVEKLVAAYDIGDERIHIVEGDVADAVNKVIEDHDISVVVAGAISRSWLERVVIGSTAETLLNAVDTDLVIINAGR